MAPDAVPEPAQSMAGEMAVRLGGSSRLGFGPAFSWMATGDSLVFLGPLQTVRLPGRALADSFRRIAPMLDGRTPLREVVGAAGVPAEVLHDTLVRLVELGVLFRVAEEGPEERGESPRVLLVLLDRHRALPSVCAQISEALPRLHIRTVVPEPWPHGAVSLDELTHAWNRGQSFDWPAPVSASSESAVALSALREDPCDMAVLLGRSPYPLAQLLVAQELMRRGVPHLFASLTSQALHLGPLVVPGESCCALCKLNRHLANAGAAGALLVPGPVGTEDAGDPIGDVERSAALAYIGTEVRSAAADVMRSNCIATQWDIQWNPPACGQERIWKLPHCPLCRQAPGQHPAPPPPALYSAPQEPAHAR